MGGVKRAVSVAAGGDYTLVLTSATVPDMPFSDLALPNDSSTSGMKVNQSGKASKNNIVVVGGLFSKTDGLSRMPRQVSNGSIPEITSGLIDNDEGSDDESQDNDDDEGDAEEDVGEHHDHDEMTRGFLNVKNGGTCTPPGKSINFMRLLHSHYHKCNMVVAATAAAYIYSDLFHSDLRFELTAKPSVLLFLFEFLRNVLELYFKPSRIVREADM